MLLLRTSVLACMMAGLCLFAIEPPAEGPEMIRPLVVGADAPSAQLSHPDGVEVSLKDYYASDKPTVLVFYRGSWCPYCQKQLAQLQASLADLKDQAQFLIISQDTVTENKGVMAKHKLVFPILADPQMAIAQKLGIVFKVDAATQKTYLTYGIDLQKLYGRDQPLMPTPAVFVVRDGKISFSYVNPDYTKRLSPDVLRAVLKAGT